MLTRLLREIELDSDLFVNVVSSHVRCQDIDVVPLVHTRTCLLDFRFVNWFPDVLSHLLVNQEKFEASHVRECALNLHGALFLRAD